VRNLTKVHGIEQSFSWSKNFGFNEISPHFFSLMTKNFHFTRILQVLTSDHYLLAFSINFSHVDPNLTLATFIGVGSPLIYCPISITLSI